MTVFYDAIGRPHRYPTTHAHAMEIKSAFYDDGVKCESCNQMSIKYSHDHQCRWCVRLDAVDFYNLAKGSPLVSTDPDTGEHYAVLAGGTHRVIPDEKYNEMLELVDVLNSDPAFTVVPDPCNKKAHYGMRRLGKCYQCQQDRIKLTPRLQALADGLTWYTPTRPCKRCGEYALKNVHNGQCQGCVPPRAQSSTHDTPETVMMRDNPDMVISRDDAREYGLKVYRTGTACRRGHTGWRYVSTGNCIDCLRM